MEGKIPHDRVGLTEKVVKDLQERSLEKRLNAARLVEQDIDERLRERDLAAVQTRILYFSQLTQDYTNITNRRSGLFGLSFVGMAIYQKLRVSKFTINLCLTYSELFYYSKMIISSTKLWSSSLKT